MHRPDDLFFFDDMRTTDRIGRIGLYCFVCCCPGLVWYVDATGGALPPTTTQRVRSHHATAQHRDCRLEQGVASPKRFCRFWVFLLFLLGLVALFFLSSGWVGLPLAVFSPSPLARVAFLSSGWVGSPCRGFPVFSPWFLGGVGARFFFFSCYLLRLASFSLLQLG